MARGGAGAPRRLRGVTDAIPYSIRRSPRARRVSVTVDASTGVEVVLPRRARDREAAAAVRELRPWIERRLRSLERARAELGLRPGLVPYLGETLELRRERGRERVARRGDELLVPAGDHRPALERWYRRRALIWSAITACSVRRRSGGARSFHGH